MLEEMLVLEEGYIQGLIEGSLETTLKSFHPEAIMTGYLRKELSTGSIKNLGAYYEQHGAAPAIKYHIVIIDLTTTTAVARVELEECASNDVYIDYHSLIKVNGKWEVIAKLLMCVENAWLIY